MRPGLEGTGPAIDLGMAMSALNTGAASWMWDWEDAGGDYKDQLYRAWQNLGDILAHKWDGRPYEHPGKKRTYRIEGPFATWPTIFHRVPGLHLRNRQISVDRRAGAGDHARARHPRAQQLRRAAAQRLGHLLLHAEDRDLAGSAPRRDAAEGARGGDGRPPRHPEDQDAERARRVRAAAGSDHVGAAREPDRPERRPVGLHQQPRGDVPPRPGDGDSRTRTPSR